MAVRESPGAVASRGNAGIAGKQVSQIKLKVGADASKTSNLARQEFYYHASSSTYLSNPTW